MEAGSCTKKYLYPNSLMLARPHRFCEMNGRQLPPLSRSRPTIAATATTQERLDLLLPYVDKIPSRKSVIPSLPSVRFPSYFIHQSTSLSFIWREPVIHHVSSRKQRVPTQPGLGSRHTYIEWRIR